MTQESAPAVTANSTMRFARKVVVGVIGGSVLLIGFAMVVLPGPSILVIPSGLAILATEFVWAKRWLARFKDGASAMANAVRKKGSGVGGEGSGT